MHLTAFSNLLTILIIVTFTLVIGVMIAWVLSPRVNGFLKSLSPQVWISLSLLVAAFSTAMSLTYSNWYALKICSLCYYQRMFMYPVALMLFIALVRKDAKVWTYVLPLSIIGFFIAMFHYAGHIQAFVFWVTDTSILPCEAYGLIPSCAETYVISYGFMTIPLMAAAGFLLIILGMLFARKSSQ